MKIFSLFFLGSSYVHNRYYQYIILNYFILGDLKAENLLLDEHGNIKVAGIYLYILKIHNFEYSAKISFRGQKNIENRSKEL